MPSQGGSRWVAVVSLVTALLACYGTLALVGILSVMGISIVINAAAWAGVITVFAGLTVLGVALGLRRHRRPPPIVLALFGFALIAWAMLGHYDRTGEIAGFALLIAATAWDWQVRRRHLSGDQSPAARPGCAPAPTDGRNHR